MALGRSNTVAVYFDMGVDLEKFKYSVAIAPHCQEQHSNMLAATYAWLENTVGLRDLDWVYPDANTVQFKYQQHAVLYTLTWG